MMLFMRIELIYYCIIMFYCYAHLFYNVLYFQTRNKNMAGINNACLNARLPQRFSVDSDTYDRSALGDIDPDRNFLNEFTSCSNTYYDETEFNNKFRNSGNLSLLHLNIRSVRSHFTEFLCYSDTLDIDFKIIGLSETFINETDINYNIPKYNYELNCRQRRRGGGAGVG